MGWRFLTLSAICATALLVQPAFADLLDISFVSATQAGSPGGTLTFSGTVTNNSGIDLFANDAGINLAGFGPGDSDLTDFILNFSGPLANGSSIGPADLFTVTIPNPFTTGSYAGVFTIQGGADASGDVVLGTANFEVDVAPSTSAVPEPGSLPVTMALLGVMGLVGYRWRRKQTAR